MPRETRIKSTLTIPAAQRVFFCSRCAKFLRLILQARPIFQLLRLFGGISWRFLRHLAHYGRSSPLTMYKLLKANNTLSWASFLAKPL
jgi:hypothetical protein